MLIPRPMNVASTKTNRATVDWLKQAASYPDGHGLADNLWFLVLPPGP